MFKEYLGIKKQQRELDIKINGAKKIGKGVVVGLSVGTLMTMILTPISGKKLRKNVKDGVIKTKEFASDKTHDMVDKTDELKQKIVSKTEVINKKFEGIKNKYSKDIKEETETEIEEQKIEEVKK